MAIHFDKESLVFGSDIPYAKEQRVKSRRQKTNFILHTYFVLYVSIIRGKI